ncbi:MAG: ribosome biogenesis GTP-binding protein YihA/YsxC [Zoogloeaceae bacterium]|jgi:GTP-binding protein|nr:ribosome biogenesis GTP-binding protein YihA/YsxC [Zoogloeaceae bacterium]
MQLLFRHANFLTTVARLADLPRESLREVAFAGRSNAGKSSAINTLCGRTRLAHVSRTPGRTQHLNYFTVAPDTLGKYFVDLPGYGFAKAPEAVRREWKGLVGPYLLERATLAGLILIMDCRRPLTELDQRLLAWFLPTGRPVHLLLSKSDKLSRQARTLALRQVRAALTPHTPQCSVQLFSSLKKEGINECETILRHWLELPGERPPATKPPHIAPLPGV